MHGALNLIIELYSKKDDVIIRLEDISEAYEKINNLKTLDHIFGDLPPIYKEKFEECDNMIEYIDDFLTNEEYFENNNFELTYASYEFQSFGPEIELTYTNYVLCDVSDSIKDVINFNMTSEDDEEELLGAIVETEIVSDIFDLSECINKTISGDFELIQDLDEYGCDYFHSCYNFPNSWDQYIDYEQYFLDNWNITETERGYLLG